MEEPGLESKNPDSYLCDIADDHYLWDSKGDDVLVIVIIVVVKSQLILCSFYE